MRNEINKNTVQDAAVLISLMGVIYEIYRWDDLRWHDIFPDSMTACIQIKKFWFKYIYCLPNSDVINSDHMTSNCIIVTNLTNALLGNSFRNTIEHPTVGEAVFSMSWRHQQ
jgi:hypothetical protein